MYPLQFIQVNSYCSYLDTGRLCYKFATFEKHQVWHRVHLQYMQAVISGT